MAYLLLDVAAQLGLEIGHLLGLLPGFGDVLADDLEVFLAQDEVVDGDVLGSHGRVRRGPRDAVGESARGVEVLDHQDVAVVDGEFDERPGFGRWTVG